MKHSKASISRFVLLGMTTMLVVITSCENGGTPLTTLTYPTSALHTGVHVEISEVSPILTPQQATAEYSVNPPLPTGLELHRSSGIIDGTPTAGHSSTVHTITAKSNGNYTGSVTAAITITVNPVSAQELPRSTAEFYQTGLRPDDYRTNFAAFSIQAESKTDYRLAVREKSKGEPDAQSIRDSAAAIIRTLNETPINVYLSFPMDASLFDAATEWLDTADNPILTHAMVEDAQLQADTDYALYAVSESDTSDSIVYHLLDFKTDVEPAADLTALPFFYNVLPNHIFTLRRLEPFLYMFGVINFSTPVTWKDTNFLTSGTVNTLSTILPSGAVVPPSSDLNPSTYFTAMAANKGRFAMVSKMSYQNTAVSSGSEFSIIKGHGDSYNSMYSTKFVIQ